MPRVTAQLGLSMVAIVALGCAERQGIHAGEATGDSGSGATASSTETGPLESETGEPDPTTESGPETETGTEDSGASACESDDDCFLGGCIEGECFACEFEWDCSEVLDANLCEVYRCTDSVCSVEPRECDAGPSCSTSACDPLDPHQQHPPGWPCQVEYCELYDGIPEMTLFMATVNWTPPSALDIGGEVEVLGMRGCGHTWFVRDLATDELLLLKSLGHESTSPSVDGQYQEGFGRSFDELTAPLDIDYEDHGVCETVETDCGPRSRGSVDVLHEGLPDARILDERSGWASGGYFVNANATIFGEVWCIYQGRVEISVDVMRDACEGDACPAATFDAGCEPDGQTTPDGFTLVTDFGDHYLGYTYWGFECRIIGASESQDQDGTPLQIRELDCVAQFQPSVVDDCDH